MKVLLLVVCVLIASTDGFVAIYSAMQRVVLKKRNTTISQNGFHRVYAQLWDILDADGMKQSLGGLCNPVYPKVVCDNGGRTGRGNPHLTRDRYVDISNIDTAIERITCQAYD